MAAYCPCIIGKKTWTGGDCLEGSPILRESAEDWAKKAAEFIEELPAPPISPLPAERAHDLSQYRSRPGLTTAEAWQKCAAAIEHHDVDAGKAYRDEIDTLLVFAGLFSAVLTAFIIESYQWLQDNPNDVIIALLAQLTHQPGANQSVPIPAGLPDAVAARINAYWFLSLTLSLSAALSAILCKQWVREFERRPSQSNEQFIGIRQMKLEGFERWGVASVVETVPLLLQGALGLFAVGVIELLWRLHRAVAVVVLIPTVAASAFYTITTLLPALQALFSPFASLRTVSQCPFKSAQAMLVLRTLVLLTVYVRRGYYTCIGACWAIDTWLLVFRRRVRAALHPELLPGHPGLAEADNELVNRASFLGPFYPLWRRLRRPWQYGDQAFYIRATYVPSWILVRRWLQEQLYFLPCCRPSEHKRDASRYKPPGFVGRHYLHLKSWTTFDRKFNSVRDTAYDDSEFEDAMTSGIDAVPALSCFRGLSWLKRQADQPDLALWIWLVVWDIAANVRKRGHRGGAGLSSLQHGVLHLLPDRHAASFKMVSTKSSPLVIALIYALETDVPPALVSEAFVHLMPDLTIETAVYLWRWITEHTIDVWHDALVALLAYSLNKPSGGPTPDLRKMLVIAAHATGRQPRSLSLTVLACLCTTYFRDLRAHRVTIRHAHEDLSALLRASLLCLANGGQSDCPSPGVTSVFTTLVVDFDLWLQHTHNLDVSDDHVLEDLRLPHVRKAYLDLLAPEIGPRGSPWPGSITAAKYRLERRVNEACKSAPRYRSPRFTPKDLQQPQATAGDVHESGDQNAAHIVTTTHLAPEELIMHVDSS